MTPLEEIEQAIDYHSEESDDYRRIEILSPLYIARAIERLEATLRAIGIILQERKGEFRITRVGFGAAPEPEESEAPAESRPGRCVLCGMPLGEQHSPHCSRQGKVSIDSTRV